MFNYDKEYSNEEIGSGTQRIQESGCYIATIERVGLLRTDTSKSEALTFNLSTEDGGTARFNVFYKDKKGNDLDFNNKNLTHLVDLLKINPSSLKETKDNEGKFHIPILENKKIGLFLSYEGVEKYKGTDGNDYENSKYNLRGFFDPASRRTIKEINDNIECRMFDVWTKNFENENRIREKKENEKSQYNDQQDNFGKNIDNADVDPDDDFPFN